MADKEADQDNALADSFPASDPPSTSNPAGGITGSPQDPPARPAFEPPNPNEPVPPPPGIGPQEAPPPVELPPPVSVPGTEPPPMTA
jgi:hypothetical protein